MGRYGMLDCANNFSTKYGSKLCSECKVIDDEGHRMNACGKWKDTNFYNSDKKIDYDKVFSDDDKLCMEVVETIILMWDLENGKNQMRVNQ